MNRRNFAKSITLGSLGAYVTWLMPARNQVLIDSDVKSNHILDVWNQSFNVTPAVFLSSKKLDITNIANVKESIRDDFATECTINYRGAMLSKIEFAMVALLHSS